MSKAPSVIRRGLRRAIVRRPSLVRFVAHRVIVFVALLLVAIQLAAFVALDRAVSDNARAVVREELGVGERVFQRVLDDRSRELVAATGLLTSDFGLRQAATSGNRDTIESALENHGSRIGAAEMTLVGLDGEILGDTNPRSAGSARRDVLGRLVEDAEDTGSAAGVAVIDGAAYQVAAVPMLAPAPVGWVVAAFEVDSALAEGLGEITGLDVSFALWERARGWTLPGSTVSSFEREAMLRSLADVAPGDLSRIDDALHSADRQLSASVLSRGDDAIVVALLQRSVAAAIARFDGLRSVLLVLAVFGLCATVAGSVAIARSISQPVSELAAFARRLERGDYDEGPPHTRWDELGELAAVFNRMRLAIAGREQEIRALALQDALTGLPNRALFNERLQQALGVAQRLKHQASVLLIDLNRFKEVNDTLGHHVGDLLLCEVAARLRATLGRASDTAARLGGDEFAVLLPTASPAMAEAAARRILDAFDAPVVIDGRRLDVGGSIGIATYPVHASDAPALVSRADAAMYAAKRNQLGCAIYEPRFDADSQGRLSLMSELRQALERDELVLHYQPRLDLGSGRVVGVEALVRWHNPTRGFVPPDAFIPFAEQTGLIREITQRVVERAFAQGTRWRAAGHEFAISINLSARDLVAPELPARVADLLAASGASAQWFRFEITESAIVDDPLRAHETVARLHDMGFGLSIDDFGTGYSSLAQLKRLPVAELKIDKSFVMDMAHDPDDMAIVRSVIDLAHNMGLVVVAEGVESAEVLELLRGIGCDAIQGYHISKPLPADRLESWLEQRDGPRPKVLPFRRVV